MLRKQLSEEGVAKLKPPAKGQIDYFDTLMPGLILRVGYGGSKTWLVRHYLKRRNSDDKKISIPTTHKIGRYPILKVKEARDKARVFLADPAKAKAEADIGSLKEVAENFIRWHVEDPDRPLRTRDEIVRLLNTLVYPAWADRQFRGIKRSDVANLLDKIKVNNGSRQSGKAFAIIRKLMNWFASRNDDYVSPIVKDMNPYKAADHERNRVLGNVRINGGYDDDEIRAVWKACDDMGTFGALLKTLLLTAQRKEKVATMRWDDIRDGVWTIPREAREKTNPGMLKLPPAVLDIINAQSRIAGNPYVFAGRGHGPIKSLAQGKKALDKKLGELPHWVIHDLRRTAKTLMARAGVRPDISERVLGHTIRGVEGVYDQYPYDDEKADALNRLAALVETIINPPSGNVVAMAEAAPKARKASRRAR